MATRIESKPAESPERGNSVADEYRKRASCCLELAKQMSLTADRATLFEMARDLAELAKRAEAQVERRAAVR